jgi:hypothetical protein
MIQPERLFYRLKQDDDMKIHEHTNHFRSRARACRGVNGVQATKGKVSSLGRVSGVGSPAHPLRNENSAPSGVESSPITGASLRQSFDSEHVLTPGQDDLVGALQDFMASDENVFLIKGYAGTGKTFLLKALTRYLRQGEVPYILAAPTGRAAKVITQRTGAGACTLHRVIYKMDEIKEYSIKGEAGAETFKYYFELAANFDDARTVYIVDEASMVSDAYSEAEFFRFGSGHLLRDFMDYVNLDQNDHRKKIIFVGDPAQLPPVNDSFSPALCEAYLEETYSMQPVVRELTEVVRQGQDSGILKSATSVREQICRGLYNVFELDTTPADIDALDVEDVQAAFQSACGRDSDDECIIVAWSNQKVKEYNNLIRQVRFPDQADIQAADRVLVVHNNYQHEMPLMNGDFGVVTDVGNVLERRTVFLNKPQDGVRVNVPIELVFRDVVIQFTDMGGDVYEVACKINNSLLDSGERGLSSDEHKALYIDFKARHTDLRPGTPDFKKALKSDPYFNCLHIKYGYAVTCHKAQGGEWRNVFVDFSMSADCRNEAYFRWAYTAMTRARRHLYGLNVPRFGVLSPRCAAVRPASRISNNVIGTSDETVVCEHSNKMAPGAAFLERLYHAVARRVSTLDVGIKAVVHKSYCEHVTFEQGERSAVALLDYNGREQITHVRWTPGSNGELVEQIGPALSDLCGIHLPVGEMHIPPAMPIGSIPDGAGHLARFLTDISNASRAIGIRLSEARHISEYHARYVFVQGTECGVVNCYFNQQGVLTKFIPDARHSSSSAFLDKILSITV